MSFDFHSATCEFTVMFVSIVFADSNANAVFYHPGTWETRFIYKNENYMHVLFCVFFNSLPSPTCLNVVLLSFVVASSWSSVQVLVRGEWSICSCRFRTSLGRGDLESSSCCHLGSPPSPASIAAMNVTSGLLADVFGFSYCIVSFISYKATQ